MHRSRLLTVMMILALSTTARAGQTKSQKAGTPADTKPSTTAPAAGPRISEALVSAIQEQTKERSETEFLGISEFRDDSHAIHVNSNRNLIAWQTAKAAASGGRYRPGAAERLDFVTVDCGDSDLGDIFECSRVRVLGPDKRLVKPVSYRASANSYRNAMGATWRVREVLAIYAARDLSHGFSVEYADFNGIEWTLVVSADDAKEKLLLTLGEDLSAR